MTDMPLEDAVMLVMTLMTQARNRETGQHILRARNYVRILAQTHDPRMDAGRLTILSKAAALHDIGKVGVPDHILLKPGPLTPEEFAAMQRHTVYGRDMIVAAKQQMRAPEEFLRVALNIVCHHHERWDGRGYPAGLAGEAIPYPARLMAVADVYDALTSARPYKTALPHEEAMGIIRNARGTHFDPTLVDILEDVQEDIATVAEAFADGRADTANSEITIPLP